MGGIAESPAEYAALVRGVCAGVGGMDHRVQDSACIVLSSSKVLARPEDGSRAAMEAYRIVGRNQRPVSLPGVCRQCGVAGLSEFDQFKNLR